MTFRQDIDKASNETLTSSRFIHLCNLLIILFAVIGAPFTMFSSLFALLVVPFNSALAAISANTHRQKELTKVHLMMLADLHGLN